MSEQDFPIRYSRGMHVLAWPLGLGDGAVTLDGEALDVKMGWAFHARIPRSAIASARSRGNSPWAIGVHTNMRGSWVVNGSASQMVELTLKETIRARSSGFPIRVRKLSLSLDDPEGFLAALGAREE